MQPSAHQGHDLELLALEVPRGRYAQRRGDGGGGVARAEDVVLGFGPLGEARYPTELADAGELLAAAGEDLVAVALVAGVEHDLVRGVLNT